MSRIERACRRRWVLWRSGGVEVEGVEIKGMEVEGMEAGGVKVMGVVEGIEGEGRLWGGGWMGAWRWC